MMCQLGPPLALFSSGKKHWLTIEYEGGATC